MHWRVPAAVLLVALAGCGSVGLGGSGPTETVTPAPVPTPSPTPEDPRVGIAPGLSAEGVFDLEYLLQGHIDAAGGMSYEWEEREREVFLGDGEGVAVSNSRTLVVENATTYYQHISSLNRYIDGNLQFLQGYEEYASGGVEYTRFHRTGRTGVVYRRSNVPAPTSEFATLPVGEYRRYMPLENVTVVRLSADPARYELTGNRSSVAGYEGIRNVSSRAVVRADGFVERIDVTVHATRNDDPFLVEYTSQYSRIGNATVAPPDWLGTARERTGG